MNRKPSGPLTLKDSADLYSEKKRNNQERRIQMNERKKVNLLGPVRRWMLAMASLAGLVLLFSAPSGAQSTPEKSTPGTPKVVAPPSEKPSPAKAAQSHANGKTEGIEVHGHWMIEVRNPDGTVVTHREFENSLVSSGRLVLASVLGRQNTAGAWALFLASQTVQPCVNAGVGQVCEIFEPAFTAFPASGAAFTTLSVSVGTAGSLVLSGTAVAGENGTIDSVQSTQLVCGPTVSPATCPSGPIASSIEFSLANLSPSINVSFGQTVAVTVTFTFA
jgi:hypothetical protein